jgi:hypothetical protein
MGSIASTASFSRRSGALSTVARSFIQLLHDGHARLFNAITTAAHQKPLNPARQCQQVP